MPVAITKEHVNSVVRAVSEGTTSFADGDVLLGSFGEEESLAAAACVWRIADSGGKPNNSPHTGNLQVVRRLRGIIKSISTGVSVLQKKLDLLDRTAEKLYSFQEDLDRFPVPDSQGLGGASRLGVQLSISEPE